jgi:iron complex outermembrane recepter protein
MSVEWKFIAGVMASCLVGGTPAYAEVPAAANPPDRYRRAGDMLEEIIVSARKREEKLQETPLSITAFSATSLRNSDILRSDDLTRFTPNLKFEQAPTLQNAAGVMIRGIGNTDTIATRDTGVGVYIDGVYMARAESQLIGLTDIQRVEVLRGPQGTLFGRNTIGGAINIITQRPLDEFMVDASARVGNLDLFQSRGVVHVPLVPEKAAAMFTFSSISREGYTENQLTGHDTDDRRSLGARAALRLNPTDNLEVMLTGEQTRSHQSGRGGECRFNPAALAAAPIVRIEEASGFRFTEQCVANDGDDELAYRSPFRPKDNSDNYAATSQILYEVGGLTLKSLSSWARQENEVLIDLSFTNVVGPGGGGLGATPYGFIDVARDQNDQASQEFSVNGEAMDGRLDYTAGLYGFYEKTRPSTGGQFVGFNLCQGDPNAIVLPADIEAQLKPMFVPFGQDPNQPLAAPFKQAVVCSGAFTARGPRITTNAYAGYGQATYDLTDRLHVTGGARYSVEMKSFRFQQRNFLSPTLQIDPFAGSPVGSQSERFAKWTPLANLTYDLTEDSIVYASYTRGFKSGGFNGRPNANVPVTLLPFDQEVLDSYEVGYKSTAFGNRLQTNVAVFYGRYDDIQRSIVSAGPGGQFAGRVANAGEAVIRGAEIELRAAPLMGLELRAGVGFTDAEYREFDDNVRGPIVNGVQTLVPVSRRDEEFFNTPNFTGTFTAVYTLFDFAGLGDLSTQLNWYHQNEVSYSTPTDTLVQGSYGLLSGQIFLRLPDGKTEIGVFGDNLLDRRYLNGGISFEDGFAIGNGFYGPPRSYGLEIRRRF